MIRFIDVDPQLDRLFINPQKSHNRCPSPLHSKGRKRLDMESFMEKCDGQNFGGHHSSLTTSSMKSNLDHE
jgi:hypothetical protein